MTMTSVVRSETSRSVVGLDLLRFAAALGVVGFHLGCTSWIDPRSEAAGLMAHAAQFPEWLPVTGMGWIGVQMFFVISGFVIAFSAQASTASRFLESRLLRLLPGIWISATISLVLALGFSPDGAPVLLDRYLRTLVVFPLPRWIDGVYWTLSIEMAFYALVWALLVRRRLDRLEPIMLAVGLVSSLVWAFAATGWWPGLDVLADKRAAQLLLVTHGCEFALGVLTWRIAHGGASAPRLVGAVFCLVGALCQIHAACAHVRQSQGIDEPFAVAAGLFIAFIVLFGLAIRGNGWILRGLSPRLVRQVRLLGLSTYPLYLVHTFVGVLAIRAARALDIAASLALIIGVGAAVLSAILIARFAEPWLRRRLAAGISRLMVQAARLHNSVRRRRSSRTGR